MAHPNCPRCSKTNFARHQNVALNAWLIHCTNCGAVVGTIPISMQGTGVTPTTTGATGGKTGGNAWQMKS
jgi:ribosomal protein S27AE